MRDAEPRRIPEFLHVVVASFAGEGQRPRPVTSRESFPAVEAPLLEMLPAFELVGLRAGMLAVAADRGARGGELLAARNGLRPAADLVWQYLDQSAESWMLVLDNADEPEILRDGSWLRTSPRGTVVVTTRRAAARWWPGAELLHIGVLPREDADLVLPDVDRRAVRGLKFSATLPERLAVATVAARLADFESARSVLGELHVCR